MRPLVNYITNVMYSYSFLAIKYLYLILSRLSDKSTNHESTVSLTKLKPVRLTLTITLLFLIVLTSCDSPNISEKEIDLSSYHIEKGFQLEAIASEPLLIAPMVIDFDENGRIWVLELPGYMADIDGKGEHDPTGRILILEDQNKNGRMDQAHTFLDGLVAPRAMLLAYGGLLYAEPPNLWFVEIQNDQPLNKVLVDSSYVQVGNIEHQANALTMNIDNWIYSSRSNARYQKRNGQWVKEQTAYRGQWGLTKDHLGRLFYNDNSNQFQGDFVLPMAALNNNYLRPKHSIRQQIVKDQRLYPLHAPAINRGYIEGNLDKDGKPINATSACGPVIYQGDLFGEDYLGNSFVCLPEGNIVKRNIIHAEKETIIGSQAWEGKEFIASADVAFRPINLYNGPEGALYIIDLHKGIIQHRAYMSPYLRKIIEEQQLDTIIGMGRVLRVVPKGFKNSGFPVFDTKNIVDLVSKLESPKVWVRDKAHQIIVQNQLKEAIPYLENLIRREKYSIAQIHALWVLEGLNGLTFTLLDKATEQEHPSLCGLAFYLMDWLASKSDPIILDKIVHRLFNRNDPQIDLYLAATFGKLPIAKNAEVFSFYKKLETRYPNNTLFAELAFSSLSKKEAAFIKEIEKPKTRDKTTWMRLGYNLLANIAADKKNKEMLPARDNPYGDKRQKGLDLYRQYCAVCHSEDGNGIENMAPPLYDSDYVMGSTDRLASIILHGLEGPIHIKGKRYEFNAVMPGIGNNPDLSDQDILSIIAFVRNAFMTTTNFMSVPLNEERLQMLRKQTPPGGGLYNEELLNAIYVAPSRRNESQRN